jgi:hypothetical protein
MFRKLSVMCWVALALALAMADTCSAQTIFDHAEYLKAAVEGQKKDQPMKGSLSFDSEKKTVGFLDHDGSVEFAIPYPAITDVLYEEASRPRYAEAVLISPLFLLTSSKKHFLTIHYASDTGAGQFVIVRLDKKNYRNILATAEAQTGKSVTRSVQN